MNLALYYPENFEDWDIDFKLDRLYNQHVTHTHQKAIEEIFLAGISYAVNYAANGTGNKELREDYLKMCQQHEELCKQHDALKLKYDALNAKFNLNQPTVAPEEAEAERAKLIRQAMGMGTVFQVGEGYEQRS